MSAHRLSAATGRLRRSVEQQELWGRFVDKLDEQKIGEEAAPASTLFGTNRMSKISPKKRHRPPAARRDEPGPITLCRTAAASRREPTGELGAAALDRAASEASSSRQPADMAVAMAGFFLHLDTHTTLACFL